VEACRRVGAHGRDWFMGNGKKKDKQEQVRVPVGGGNVSDGTGKGEEIRKKYIAAVLLQKSNDEYGGGAAEGWTGQGTLGNKVCLFF